MTVPARCISVRSVPRISVSENGRTLTIVNPDGWKISQVSVDGCAITDGERCDYMFQRDAKCFFVELKGSDIRKAVSQIQSSVEKLASGVARASRSAAMVASRVPKEDTSTMLAKQKLLRDYVARLVIKNGSLEVEAGQVL